MKKELCCLISPVWGCVGCDVQYCDEHTAKFSATGWPGKCPGQYKANWSLDRNGHAWGMLDTLEGFRWTEKILRRDGRVV